MTQTKLNIELFKKVREKIATTPEAYDQDIESCNDPRSPCGTVACIGGWADILSAPTETERRARMRGLVDLDRAADSLGLNGKSFWQEYASDAGTERGVLFSGDPDKFWPEPFAAQLREAKTLEPHTQAAALAKIAVAYLDKIISTGKVLE